MEILARKVYFRRFTAESSIVELTTDVSPHIVTSQ